MATRNEHPPLLRRIRIVSDGGPLAEITDADTGAPIPGVHGVTWAGRAGEMATARLETYLTAVDVVGLVDASIPDTAMFVKRLEAIADALHLVYLYAEGNYGSKVSASLKDAMLAVNRQAYALAPRDSEEGDSGRIPP